MDLVFKHFLININKKDGKNIKTDMEKLHFGFILKVHTHLLLKNYGMMVVLQNKLMVVQLILNI